MSDLAVLDVVIPARNEATRLAQTLKALYLDAGSLQLSVYLALNGEQMLEMDALAREIKPEFTKRGHRFTTLQCSDLGKTQALNAADRVRNCSNSVLYLDADCQILSGTLPAIWNALRRQDPLMVAPRMNVVPSKRFLTRSYFEVWQRLPNIVDDVVGAGCFAVNESGRKLWKKFPERLPDDAFVRSLFAKRDRWVLPKGGFYFVPPEGRDLLATIKRWSAGNSALRSKKPFGKMTTSSFYRFGRDRRIWKYLPVYALLQALSVMTNANSKFKCGWTPSRDNLLVKTSVTKSKCNCHRDIAK